MIFYFSATGNSRHVAQRLATALGDETADIAQRVRGGDFSLSLGPGEAVGIVCPTYFWGVPAMVADFLQQLDLPETPYLYFVTTYGAVTGAASMAERLLRQRGHSLTARFGVKMPDNWTPMFDLSDKAAVAHTNALAEPQIDAIIEKIKAAQAGDFTANKVPGFVARVAHLFYDRQRGTGKFTVEPSCVGCGLCAKHCPDGAITIQDGKPVWIKDRCQLCLGCLHRCPQFSIQYGPKTKQHGQYLHPGETAAE